MSSINTMTNLPQYGLQTRFIKSMKTAGALVNPKGITVDSKCHILFKMRSLEWHPHALVADDNLDENLSLRKDTLLGARRYGDFTTGVTP
ncbi:hypothetical protein Tco_0919360 [Tanacetum coccineum]